jgi:3alpha(or 20beta)-hydroxysteroid dehydrogenase
VTDRLAGRVALITGGLGGLGMAQAQLFAAEGALVVVADVRAPDGELALLRGGAVFVELDVTSEESWAAVSALVTREYGRLDIVSNTAGVARIASLRRETAASYLATIAVNQLGVLLGMQAGAALMSEGGSIINIASVAGLTGQRYASAYVSSKYAVRGLTKVAALELAPAGIRVNAILPGIVDTDMVRVGGVQLEELDGYVPMGRVAQPEDIARVALFLASDDAAYLTGTEIVVDGGVTSKSQILGEHHDVSSVGRARA